MSSESRTTGPSGNWNVTLPWLFNSASNAPPSASASSFLTAGNRLPNRGPSRFKSGSTV